MAAIRSFALEIGIFYRIVAKNAGYCMLKPFESLGPGAMECWSVGVLKKGTDPLANTPILQPVSSKFRFGMTKKDTPKFLVRKFYIAAKRFGSKDHSG
jgi:hypothetical protein